jgi:peptidoglycan hydrolase-like protein with peptidoglycan-binding domain
MKRGERSFLVATLQYMLNEIGIIYDVFDALEINGEYDEETESIIKDFQERNGLEPTGEVDQTTWNFLARIYNLTLHYIEQN